MAVPKLWYLLVLVRILWTLLPQSGYIHPDEFFQSVEIVAGDFLHLDVYRAWEFNSSSPIRSIALPYLTLGPGLTALKVLDKAYPAAGTISTYPVLVVPRLTFTLLSVAMDILMYRMAKHLGFNSSSAIVMFATSYVTLVYLTRTFSNSLEAFLFIYLMYSVVMDSLNKSIKEQRSTPGHSNTFRIALTIVAGIFNRPTFVVFAFVPYVHWLLNGRLTVTLQTVPTLILSAIDAVIISFFFICCDSIYFGSLDPRFSLSLPSSFMSMMQNLSITPFNFFMYNREISNLAEHGLHPRITHFLVNCPLLFNTLVIFVVGDIFRMARRPNQLSPHQTFLLLSFIVPLFLLSIFPHQEPRFLLPLICPLVLLYSHKVYGFESKTCWTSLWIIFNVLTGVFYGVLHQGGITSAITHLTRDPQYASKVHVIFHHTYMPPRFLFTVPAESCQERKYGLKLCDTFNVHDLKGSSYEKLEVLVNELSNTFDKTSPHSVFLLTPASVHGRLKAYEGTGFIKLSKIDISFGPHVSTENLPAWDTSIKFTESLQHIIDSLVLNVYRLDFSSNDLK